MKCTLARRRDDPKRREGVSSLGEYAWLCAERKEEVQQWLVIWDTLLNINLETMESLALGVEGDGDGSVSLKTSESNVHSTEIT